MTLKQEAEEKYPLLDSSLCRTGAVEEENLQLLGHRKSFIAGANSKWVQAEKIKAQIEVLNRLEIDNLGSLEIIREEINLLKEDLKKIEDEVKI
jgi:hypothetical protein